MAKNKETEEMDFLIFDKERNIIKESKNAEALLFWIDGLLINKYGSAKPHLTDYKIIEEWKKPKL